MPKLGDYDRWFKPCSKCEHDNGRKSEKCSNKCWKCGATLQRDYSERDLKKNRRI